MRKSDLILQRTVYTNSYNHNYNYNFTTFDHIIEFSVNISISKHRNDNMQRMVFVSEQCHSREFYKFTTQLRFEN